MDMRLNQGSKKTTTSQASQKKPKFLGLFGCCFQDDLSSDARTKRTSMPFPSSFIDLDKPPLKSFLTSHTDTEEIHPPLSLDMPGEGVHKIYPIDKVFILGDAYKVVAKITSKSVFKPNIPQMPSFGTLCKEYMKQKSIEELKSPDVPVMMKKEIFSMFDKGIKASSWYEITPESIATHIAKRLQCGIMVDALCGFGGNTIQFAKVCDYVLGIDIDPTKTISAKHNAKIYGVDNKIDFLTVDFLKLKNLMGDIVYLAPSDTRQSPSESFSIFKHTDPDLRQLLAKSLEISHSIAIKLPEDTNIEELAQLFQVSLEQYKLYSKRFCVEIEKIVNSVNETECVIVYFGDCSTIELKEEHESIYEYLASQEPAEWRTKFPLHIILAVLRSIGTRKFLSYITKVEQELPTRGKQNTSIYEILLEKLVEDNIFTKNSLKKLLEEASLLSLKARMSLSKKRSLKSSRAKLLKKLSSAITTEDTEAGNNEKSLSNKKSKFSETVLGSQKEEEEPDVVESFDDITYPLPGDLQTNGILTINDADDEDDYNGNNNDEDVSDPSVSEYSVSSDYLKDDSEAESPRAKPLGKRDLINISFEESDLAFSLPKNDFALKPALKGIFRGGSTPNIMFKKDKENNTPKKTVRFGMKKIAEI